ncbi:MAG TPA: phospholipase D-like domain-containing protein [Xanthobacteraceae bacterium]|nr:phospholipase D-like domain-containing protein [Xanthobacteraceae bacterium]
MTDLLAALSPPLLAALQLAMGVVASAHVVLHKRDVRAAIGWIGLIWLVPYGGSILYALFGINRLRRRATGLRTLRPYARTPERTPSSLTDLATTLPSFGRHLVSVARLVDRVAETTLTAGNSVSPLADGARAYAAMLDAIDRAERTLGLATYIFDGDATGQSFAAALARAVQRGVAVRVLVDGVGVRYSYPAITGLLRRHGVPTAEFLPTLFPLSLHYANLRNHRKILVADGRVGFTGGLNIRQGHADHEGRAAIRDLHFRLQGPVVAHLAETFADDWAFVTGEQLSGESWFPPLLSAGSVFARGIAAGPDEAFERVRWAMLGALSQARERVRIVTPYFLPDTALSTALQVAALRGVTIDIAMPERNNLRLVQWAACAKIFQFLARGCRVWLTPPPFDHSKLMTVDGVWSFIGSTNWDPRSLRLNFEFNVECYEAALAAELDLLIDQKVARSRPLTLADVHNRSFPIKLRDGAAWLLSPYL